MIEEFSFGNFWSFKDIQTLNLTAANIKSKDAQLDIDNVIKINDKISLLKSKAIYGANASGKSNVIKALNTFKYIIINSVSNDKALETLTPFLLDITREKKPTFFQLIFRINNIRYRYGFEANKHNILSEWLFATPNIREQTLFIREDKKIIEINETHFSEGAKLKALFDNEDGENELFRENSLFLTSVASFGFGKKSKEIVDRFNSIILQDGFSKMFQTKEGILTLSEALQDEKFNSFIIQFLKFSDTGIKDIKVMSSLNTKDDITIVSIRKGIDGEEDKVFFSINKNLKALKKC